MAGYTVPGITRKHVFVEDDNDLASLADMEAGFSGNHPLFMKSSFFNASRRSSSYRVLSSSTASMRAARFYNAGCEEHHQPHFLEACFLCKKPLGDNRDIFMYRGDTPFCSEECRQQQIDIDEEKEKKWSHSASASMKALRKDQRNSSPNKTQNYPVRTSTIAAA